MKNSAQKIFAGGFSLGLITPLLAILLFSANPVVASGNDCTVSPDVGFDSTLAEVVEVSVATWGCMGALATAFYVIMLLAEDDTRFLAWFMCCCGWGVTIFNSVFQRT